MSRERPPNFPQAADRFRGGAKAVPDEIQLGGTARNPEQVFAVHAMGLSFTEVPIPDPEVFRTVEGRFLEARDATGLFYVCHGPREGDPNDPKSLEHRYWPKLITILDRMPHLGMDLLTVHLWMDARFVRKEVLTYKEELLFRLTQRAKASGITVCLENLSENTEDLRPVLAAVPDLQLTCDMGHGQLLTEKHTGLDLLAAFPDRIRHLHVHDNRGGNTPGDDLHLPIGEGEIDFVPLFKKLGAIGYAGTMTLELRPDEIARCLGTVKRLLAGAGLSVRERGQSPWDPIS